LKASEEKSRIRDDPLLQASVSCFLCVVRPVFKKGDRCLIHFCQMPDSSDNWGTCWPESEPPEVSPTTILRGSLVIISGPKKADISRAQPLPMPLVMDLARLKKH
jgi:hypothetical protein